MPRRKASLASQGVGFFADLMLLIKLFLLLELLYCLIF
jgi:hypothetical protein